MSHYRVYSEKWYKAQIQNEITRRVHELLHKHPEILTDIHASESNKEDRFKVQVAANTVIQILNQ